MTQSRRTQRRMRATLSAIEPLIPTPWSIDGLVERLGEARGRPLKLRPFQRQGDEGNMSGLLLVFKDNDVIGYAQDADPIEREQIIGHEIAHILMGHHGTKCTDSEGTRKVLLSLDISPGLIQRFIGRTTYDANDEVDAENFGTYLAHMGRRRGGLGEDFLGRLTDTLR